MKTSCDIFKGGKDKDGYGWQRALGERKAHRVAWVKANGPIPKGMLVCHSCDNPSCINPDHLWLGTPKQNMEDKQRKGRGRYTGHDCRGESNPNSRLTQEQVNEIRAKYRWGLGPVLAKEYGVGAFMITRIIRNEAWKNETKEQDATTKN